MSETQDTARLREAEQRYRVLFEQCPDGIILIDPDTARAIDFNDAAHSRLGYTREEFCRLTLQDFEALERPEETRRHIQSIMVTGRDDFETRHRTKDGRILDVYVTVQTMDLNGRTVIHSMFRDITPLKDAERRLRDHEHRLNLALEAANEAWWEWNFRTGSTIYSPQYYTMLGYAPDEFPPTYEDWRKRVHPQDIAHAEARIREHLIERKTDYRGLEFRMLCKDGTWKWLSGSGKIVERDAHGDPVRLVGTNLDISERKQAEQALRNTLVELERSNRELQNFAYIASHDLQEPLRKITSFGALLEEQIGEALPPAARDYLNRMRNAALRMQSLITSLLAYSRITTRAQSPVSVNLAETLAIVLDDLDEPIRSSHAAITVGSLPIIEAEPSQMQQLFQNLVGNSLKFRRPDVPPVLTVSARVESSLPDDAFRGEWCVLTVADNGIGFDPQHSERIFGVFQRLHGRSEYEGTGIGLAICQKIVHHHGGSITALGKPGEGAVFTVRLPLRRESS